MEILLSDPHYDDKCRAIDALYHVIDPELFINIIDLGLVYDLDFSKKGELDVIMTLSTPNCPLGDAITTGVKNALSPLFENHTIDVILVWDPIWSFDMLTDQGRAQLGF